MEKNFKKQKIEEKILNLINPIGPAVWPAIRNMNVLFYYIDLQKGFKLLKPFLQAVKHFTFYRSRRKLTSTF